MQAIPLTTDSRQRLTTVLGERSYELRVWWQPLSEAWYLSVYRRTGERIALGRQMTLGQRLTYPHELDGTLVVLPLEPDADTAGRHAWGNTHGLVYLSTEESEGVP